ncbi:MAG TPA: hydrolase [Gammaproteobacteria bacterium]|nr:hydrolase [Gammaproteobacteria bacterium]
MSPLLKASDSLLLIVDVQERLAPHVHEHGRVIENCEWLIGVAEVVGVPVFATEHYPEGIGHTVPRLRDRIAADAVLRKDHFSCVSESSCHERIERAGRNQIVVAGIEAHVCVMQSAVELKEKGRSVFLVADAVSSRTPEDAAIAVERMRAHGIEIVTREMVLFEWAHRGATEQFRQLHRRFLKTLPPRGADQQ